MKKTKFTESQIFGILKQQEGGQKVADICREHGISTRGEFGWRSLILLSCISLVSGIVKIQTRYK